MALKVLPPEFLMMQYLSEILEHFWFYMIVLLYHAVVFQPAVAGPVVKSCDNDSDCQDGLTCYNQTCKNCARCDLLFREGKNCVTDFTDCGDCLYGYEEVLVTDFTTVKKPCKLIIKEVKPYACTDDSNCPPNTYCDDESCISCFDCKLIYREQSPEQCVKDISQCGPCLKGFIEIPVTHETDYRICEMSPDYTISRGQFPITACSIITVLLVFVAVYAIWYKVYGICIWYKPYKQSKSSASIKSLCSQYNPTAPPLVEDQLENVENNESKIPVVECEIGQLQGARVFKQPNAEYYDTGDGAAVNRDTRSLTQSVQPSSVQGEETNSNHYITAICQECARIYRECAEMLIRNLRGLSTDSVLESHSNQTGDMSALDSNSSGNNLHSDAVNNSNEAQVSETNEVTEDLPVNQSSK